MREHFVGRTPRLTAYFSGLALGLGLLVAGLEGIRVLLVGELSPTVSLVYAGIGVTAGLFLSFVAGYLNGSLLASWAAGFVPAAGRMGPPVIDGTLREIAVAFVAASGLGILLGSVGFVMAVEKHRHDALTADLPEPPSRAELLVLVALSVVVGSVLFRGVGLL